MGFSWEWRSEGRKAGNKKTSDGCPPEVQKFYESNVLNRLRNLDINCIHSFFATLSIESDVVAFADVVNQPRDMNKNFLVRGAVNNKAKSFGFVEELYGSTVHLKKIENCDVAKCRDKGRGDYPQMFDFQFFLQNLFFQAIKPSLFYPSHFLTPLSPSPLKMHPPLRF